MNDQWFRKLKEYESLEKLAFDCQKALKGQEDRLIALDRHGQTAREELHEAEEELKRLKDSLSVHDQQLQTLIQQQKRLLDSGAEESKLKNNQNMLQELEELMFQKLEKTEELESLTHDKKNFLQGLEKSKQEISAEVQAESSTLTTQQEQFRLRQQLLKDELPDAFRAVLDRIVKKKPAVSPFTRSDNGHCLLCRVKLSQIEESEIEGFSQLRQCRNCSRIFLPTSL